MKTTNIKWFTSAGLLIAAICFSAWKTVDSTQPVNPFSIGRDADTSVPGKKSYAKKEYKVGDLDQAMKELDKAMIDMDKNIKIDFSKMDKEMKIAMEEIKKIDFEKIGRDVEASLQKIDWEKTRIDVNKTLREAETQFKEVNMQKIEKQIEHAKEQLSNVKIHAHVDMEKFQRSVNEGFTKARSGIEKAKKELTLLKEFTEALENDGLISKKKGYKIEIKNSEMYINGTKQSKEVNDKYRKYFKDEAYTIRSDGDEISNL